MSTDHQKYSTENQAERIAQYAAQRGFVIVRTYADEGRSGLKMEGRDALKKLIEDVRNRQTDFEAVLVYDVSRWGRFQDADESAYYEYLCREAGILVHYCAEQFENDGSLSTTIIKNMKRAMAGEYSRELSSKVFAGQCRLIGLGFRQGGVAGFGLRRCLIDEARNPKGELQRGEHKSLQTDRVILVPGPTDEVETVQRIYRLFVVQRHSEREIAAALNHDKVTTDLGRAWSRGTVHQVLTNEKYIGNNVYNRVSFKLKAKRIVNARDMWVRAEGAFEGIVERDFFEAAQRIIQERSRRYSNDEMLAMLADLLSRRGCLSGLIIDELDDMPSSAAYRHRFGSLVRAYSQVGYTPDRDYRYLETNRVLRLMHPDIVSDAVARIEQLGARAVHDPATDLLTINGEFTVSIVISRCTHTPAGSARWKVRLDAGLRPDVTVVVRMDAVNEAAQDYYLLPWIDVGGLASVRMAENNGIYLDAYRTDDLSAFYELMRRTTLKVSA